MLIRFTMAMIGLVTLLVGSCTIKNATIPGADIPFAEADFKILGVTSAESCGTYFAGINPATLVNNQSGDVSGLDVEGTLVFGSLSSESRDAIFSALGKMPSATHLLSPRIKTVTTGWVMGPFIMLGKRCAEVTAWGVKLMGPRKMVGKEPVSSGY